MLGAGTLRAGQDSRDTTFSGIISGVGGSLIKEGLGTLTLKHNLKANYTMTFDLPTTVSPTGGVAAIAVFGERSKCGGTNDYDWRSDN